MFHVFIFFQGPKIITYNKLLLPFVKTVLNFIEVFYIVSFILNSIIHRSSKHGICFKNQLCYLILVVFLIKVCNIIPLFP